MTAKDLRRILRSFGGVEVRQHLDFSAASNVTWSRALERDG